MPIVTQDQLPVIYADWTEWRIEQGSEEAHALVEAGHVFCPVCWGQRRVYEAAANGEGYVPRPCVDCAGRGTLPRTGAPETARPEVDA